MSNECCGHRYKTSDKFCKRCSMSLRRSAVPRQCGSCVAVEVGQTGDSSNNFLFIPEVSYEYEEDASADVYRTWMSGFEENCRAGGGGFLVLTAQDYRATESVDIERKRHLCKSKFVLIPMCRFICTQYTLSTIKGLCEGKTIYLKPPREVEERPNDFRFFLDSSERPRHSCLTTSEQTKSITRIKDSVQEKNKAVLTQDVNINGLSRYEPGHGAVPISPVQEREIGYEVTSQYHRSIISPPDVDQSHVPLLSESELLSRFAQFDKSSSAFRHQSQPVPTGNTQGISASDITQHKTVSWSDGAWGGATRLNTDHTQDKQSLYSKSLKRPTSQRKDVPCYLFLF